MAFIIPCQLLGWLKYHPVIEMLGANRFKMGEISSMFLAEIRAFGMENDNEGRTRAALNKDSNDGCIIEDIH
jgi:hypothetical protein